MSGKDCFKILEKIFEPKKREKIEDIKGYTIKYGNIVENGIVVDEVLVSYFKEPKSYTTENMCEINSHGGNIIVKKILELCLKNGAQLAEPGEFTKRAFINGRIDLSQAESVIDVINAKSDKELKAGINQLKGGLSKEIAEIKKEILDVMVNIEVAIDYPEYDVEDVTYAEITSMLESVEKELHKLEKSFDNGKIIKEGIKTAIIGKPNAGKSSLLNRILKEDRAIVTQYEGTTRDTIEELVNINGIPLKLIDTAGIRNAEDEVEKIGINKSKEIAKNAELIINNTGIEELYQKITEMFELSEINLDNELIITNIRHKNLITKALNNIQETKITIKNNMPIDIVAVNIKEILENLGNITGEYITEDIINEIFSKFCLGK